ncbi:MAG: hypothetical protein WAQ05_11575 [Rubrivivax sp.]
MNSKTDKPAAERWAVNTGAAAEARLQIPADSHRNRRFEIACAMQVRALETAVAPWHELRVYADGRLQWQRRISTAQPAAFDGLDYRFQCSVPAGQALRLSANVECQGARRLQLQIEADEV